MATTGPKEAGLGEGRLAFQTARGKAGKRSGTARARIIRGVADTLRGGSLASAVLPFTRPTTTEDMKRYLLVLLVLYKTLP
jgi:hypothetical protein